MEPTSGITSDRSPKPEKGREKTSTYLQIDKYGPEAEAWYDKLTEAAKEDLYETYLQEFGRAPLPEPGMVVDRPRAPPLVDRLNDLVAVEGCEREIRRRLYGPGFKKNENGWTVWEWIREARYETMPALYAAVANLTGKSPQEAEAFTDAVFHQVTLAIRAMAGDCLS